MRIVQHTFDFGLGGVQKGSILFADEMAKRGHECWMIGESGGARYREDAAAAAAAPNLRHVVLGSPDPAVAARVIDDIAPDVVHIHRAAYVEPLVRLLAKDSRRRLIVSTPVFGRPPEDRSLLRMTRTCLVGCYTFYRFCRWTGLSPRRAVEAGIGYVPITPYEPPESDVSTLDSQTEIAGRRVGLGVPVGAFVVGRIGRDDPAKWADSSEALVNALLERSGNVAWLSIGFPEAMGRGRLAERWGARFVNLPQTADYSVLARVLSSLDVAAFFSRGECFASSIAEAAGMGVPTVALATPLRDNGQAEQVIEGVTGRLVGDVAQACDYVRELMADRATLAALKASSRRHARERWHVARATDDLLSLYEFWRTPPGPAASGPPPSPPPPPYAEVMLREHEAFAVDYRRRMVRLMGRSAASRLKWRAILAAMESWTTFRAGRAVRRLRHWRQYRELGGHERGR
jgi:glycosyltransferase involved in cell wall biosynthesis